MRPMLALALAAMWPFHAQAEYFAGIDDINRHDIAGAIRELAPLADAGEADAQNALGVAYDHSDPTRARALFRQASDNGSLPAMMNLARWLQAGRGGAADPTAAVEWLTRAAQAGLPAAMVALGDAYLNGAGVPADKGNAQNWYQRAAQAGEVAGMAGAADLMLESPDAAVRTAGSGWLQRASDRGNPHAQQVLALAKMLGVGGFAKDEAGAVALARSAAAQGDALGAVLLAEAYRDGRGGAVSLVEATRWYAEAARLGAVRGQVETARAKLAPGPGHDPAAAYFWTQLATRHPGNLPAVIAALDEAAARELTPSQQAQIRVRAASWKVGGGP